MTRSACQQGPNRDRELLSENAVARVVEVDIVAAKDGRRLSLAEIGEALVQAQIYHDVGAGFVLCEKPVVAGEFSRFQRRKIQSWDFGGNRDAPTLTVRQRDVLGECVIGLGRVARTNVIIACMKQNEPEARRLISQRGDILCEQRQAGNDWSAADGDVVYPPWEPQSLHELSIQFMAVRGAEAGRDAVTVDDDQSALLR